VYNGDTPSLIGTTTKQNKAKEERKVVGVVHPNLTLFA
jgi:hypothetical protein